MNDNMNRDNDFSYDYEEYKDDPIENSTTNKPKNNKLKYIIIISLALILIVGLIIFLVKIFNKSDNSVTLMITEKLDLYVGDTKGIEFTVKGIKDESHKFVFMSQDESIATVSDSGIVSAISDGTTNIIVAYIDKEENRYSKNCVVSIMKKTEEVPNDEPEPEEEPPKEEESTELNLRYTLPSSSNGWYKGNVAISLNYNKSALKSLKYAINCDENCDYKDITGSNKIAVTGSGTKKVTIIAIDNNGKEEKKTVSIKIDKTKPTVKLNVSDVVYNNTGKVEVCATCTDSGSGCLEQKVCYTHTESVNSSSLIVYDRAGNSTTSTSYKVVIDKEKPTCSLTYSDKKITATVNDAGNSGLAYYGFSSTYSGTSTKEKSNVADGQFVYYVKDKAGNTNSCSLTCSFSGWYKGKTSTGASCNPYPRTEAARAGATWARECSKQSDGTYTIQLYSRTFNCN